MQKIKLLDCTIRDGGYVNDWKFTKDQVRECYKACSISGVDYMEIGYESHQWNCSAFSKGGILCYK